MYQTWTFLRDSVFFGMLKCSDNKLIMSTDLDFPAFCDTTVLLLLKLSIVLVSSFYSGLDLETAWQNLRFGCSMFHGSIHFNCLRCCTCLCVAAAAASRWNHLFSTTPDNPDHLHHSNFILPERNWLWASMLSLLLPAPIIWNELPTILKSCESLASFRNNLKTYRKSKLFLYLKYSAVPQTDDDSCTATAPENDRRFCFDALLSLGPHDLSATEVLLLLLLFLLFTTGSRSIRSFCLPVWAAD